MSKTIRLQGTELGTDITEMDIYHTEITGSNRLKSAVRRSDLLSGVTLYNVPDSATEFLIECTSGKCTATSGSITIGAYSPRTQFFTIHHIDGGSGYYGSIDTVSSVQSPYTFSITSGDYDVSVDWSTTTTYVIKATPAYPREFRGWFTNYQGFSEYGGVLSTDTTLTLTEGSYPDDIYAVFES